MNKCKICFQNINSNQHIKILNKFKFQVLGDSQRLNKTYFNNFVFCKKTGFFTKKINKNYLKNLEIIFAKKYTINNLRYGKNQILKIQTRNRVTEVIDNQFKNKDIEILEYGCGNGDLIKTFKKKNYYFDIIEKRNLKKLQKIKKIRKVFNKIPKKKKKYDLIIFDNSIIQSSDVIKELSSLINTLKDDGIIYIENKSLMDNYYYLVTYDIINISTIKSYIKLFNTLDFFSFKYGYSKEFKTEYAFFKKSKKKNTLKINNKKILFQLRKFENKIEKIILKIGKTKKINFLGAGIGCSFYLNFCDKKTVKIFDNNKYLNNKFFNTKRIKLFKNNNKIDFIKTF